ncbi:MAG: peptide deformylase [Oscillospiraceae bacterium]|nr:peptide deformylase [Oscillospiraceae bacterium]
MALRTILNDSDPSLRKKSRPVTDFDARLHRLLDDMRETLIDSGGVGLAAPQVGVLRRAVLVADTTREDLPYAEQIIELINPEIAASSGEQTGSEGCLSIPGTFGIVTRPKLVKIRAQDRDGKEFEVWGAGLTARAFCHETDHLNGVLFTDLAERLLTEEELEELRAAQADAEAERADKEENS